LSKVFGDGYWCSRPTEKGAQFGMRQGQVYLARHQSLMVVSLTLSKRKPWAIDKKYFSPSKNPLCLTAMAVDPRHQRKGLGTQCIA
jgi:GNAT superfamily N-acetyltransferase